MELVEISFFLVAMGFVVFTAGVCVGIAIGATWAVVNEVNNRMNEWRARFSIPPRVPDPRFYESLEGGEAK